MPRLTVRVQIDDPIHDDDNSLLRLALLDTSQADAHHPTVAEATGSIGSADDPVEVVIDVPEAALDVRNRYSLFAHVDHDGSGLLVSGDLITTRDVPVDPRELSAGTSFVQAPLTRI